MDSSVRLLLYGDTNQYHNLSKCTINFGGRLVSRGSC
jgi:hypothetical protein